MGCGAKSATMPHAQANHKSTAATRAVVVLQLSSASAIAPPDDTGSSAHTTRAHHNEINARSVFGLAAFDRDDELCLSYEPSCRGPWWPQEWQLLLAVCRIRTHARLRRSYCDVCLRCPRFRSCLVARNSRASSRNGFAPFPVSTSR